MGRPVILLDIDGVVCDFVGPVVGLINSRLATNYKPSDVTDWDIMGSLGVGKIDAGVVYSRIKSEGFCAGLPAYPGAKDGVAALMEMAEVHPCTSPFASKYWLAEREQWLVNFGFSRKAVTFTHAKHLMRGDILVDDKAETISRWGLTNPTGALLYNQPWNNSRVDLNSSRVRGWPAVVARCARLLERA